MTASRHAVPLDWASRFVLVSRRARFEPKRRLFEFGADPQSLEAQAQSRLNALGMASPPLSVDGILGPKSKAAISAFQLNKGLPQTGNLDANTVKALGINAASVPKITPVPMPPIPGVKQAVLDAFTNFSRKIEGSGTDFMYTDSKGYVTSGIGNLIDPISMAMALPWRHGVNGPLASAQEISDAWYTVKNAWPGVQSYACQSLTDLRLDDEGMAKVVSGKVKENHSALQAQYPTYPNWPADAQLALHSLAWAWGPYFANVWQSHGTNFKAAVNQALPDFKTAADVMTAASAHEESINPGIIPRNAANRQLFDNAADVLSKKGNFDTLYYPGMYVAAAAGIGAFLLVAGGIAAYLFWKRPAWLVTA